MCGISGLVRAGGLLPSDEEAVRRMTEAMRHRGPDSSGHLTEGNIALGIRRLRIIDLATGDQPVHSEDGKVSVILNGEIYNYRELTRELQGLGHRFATKSDTEVIVHGYEQWGEDCIQRLRGMFAFAVLDRRSGVDRGARLLLARDRMGIKPLYCYRDGGLMLFASEVRALLAARLFAREVSVEGLYSYLAFGSVQEPLSLMENVLSVPPAHYVNLDVRTGMFALRRYWDFPDAEADHGSRNGADGGDGAAVEGLRPLLREAVALRMIADVPLGAFLSGGIDSGAVVATMAKEATSPVKAFTIGFGERTFNEAPLAQRAAMRFGVEQTTIVLTPDQVLAELPSALDALDQPSIDGLNTYYVSRAARQAGMTVALSGLGGDELFAGYSTFRNVRRMLALQSAVGWVPSPVRAGAAAVWARANVASSATARTKEAALIAGDVPSGHPYFLSRALFTPSHSMALMSSAARDAYSPENAWEQRVEETLAKAAGYDPVNAVSYLECSHYLVSTLLRDTDQMSMAHSLEVRVPLIDHKLVEYMMRVPGRYKLTSTDKTPKRLLVGAMSGALPAEVVNRKKTTFTLPWELWLRGQLRSEVETTLVTLPPKSSRYLEQGKARETWRAFLSGRTSWSRPWSLYVLCRWLERNAA